MSQRIRRWFISPLLFFLTGLYPFSILANDPVFNGYTVGIDSASSTPDIDINEDVKFETIVHTGRAASSTHIRDVNEVIRNEKELSAAWMSYGFANPPK